MKFNAAQLLLEYIGAIREYEIDEPAHLIDEGVRAVSPLRGQIKLTHINRGVLADARIATKIQQECSRCLDEVLTPIDLHLVEEFYPTVDLRTGLPMKAPEGGSGFMLTEAHEVDLDEPIRQSVLLDLPMKPLCRVGCAGLCPRCGQNRNQGPCNCADEPGDHRLAGLAEWLKSDRLH
jgi:uncharacterized protein